MIILKLLFWIVVIYAALFFFFRVFGPLIAKYLLRTFVKRAQDDLNKQTRAYERYAEGHSPFEDNVFLDDDTKVSIRKNQSQKEKKVSLDADMIEEVEFEDVE
ncbi:MAG TPA: hypothetical protein ENJ82_14335 [Bacteroidetes bacterium]|nr:hypothetical protein [Bacteroidota bacterium]